MHRRDLLKLLGASGALRVLPGLAASIAPAARARRLDAIGIQLYTVRSLMERNVEGTLAALAKIGYTEVELAGLYKKTPTEWRAMLGRLHLSAPSGHYGLAEVRSNWQGTLDDASMLGHKYVVIAWIDEAERTADGIKKIAHELNAAGEVAKRSGLRLAYHNHDFEFKPLSPGGPLLYDALLASTDAKLVQMELDLFWMTKGGRAPLAYFAKHPGRFPLLHVKDMAKDGSMVDVGKGTIDFKAIFAQSAKAGVKHYYVEHDEPPDPLASARASYGYLRSMQF